MSITRVVVLLFGCLLAAPLRAADVVTFTKDVAPIVFSHCTSCHRPGEIGPFSLQTYQDVRQRMTLIANATAPRLVGTTRERLAEVPLGPPMGIPDAPDSLPGKADLVTGPWSVCTTTTGGTLLIGAAIPSPARTTQGLLVRAPEGGAFLVYGERRLLIPAGRYTATLRAFRS